MRQHREKRHCRRELSSDISRLSALVLARYAEEMLRFESTTFLVTDHDEAIAFFVHGLGFVLLQDEVTATGNRRVLVAPSPHASGLILSVAKTDAARALVGRQAGGNVAHFLHTDDFAAQHERMTRFGIRFREEPRHEPYGTVAVFEDIYGGLWDLIQPPASL